MTICDKLLGPKYRVFVKLSHVKLFLWVKIFNWAQTETSILAQLFVSYNGILRIEIFLWPSDNFFDSLKLKIHFSSKSVLFLRVDPSLTTKISNWAQAETPSLCQLLEL